MNAPRKSCPEFVEGDEAVASARVCRVKFPGNNHQRRQYVVKSVWNHPLRVIAIAIGSLP